MTRRVLAMLLAVVMLVGMLPYQVFATDTNDAQIVTEATEASVAETTASEETRETAASETTEEAAVAETTEETVVSETTEETTAPETTEETVDETTEPELETLELEPAEDAVVYITGANAGVLIQLADGTPLVNKAVTVKDLNSDGVLTYDEALIAAHKAYCPDGYATVEDPENGTAVTKLWGVVAGYNYYFFNNKVALLRNVGDTDASTVKNGDKLYATLIKDTVNASDYFTYFDVEEKTVQAGEEFTLTLKGYQGMDMDPQTQAIADAKVGTWSKGAFTALSGKTTDAEGKVTLSFDKAGTYYVTAEGAVPTTAWNGQLAEGPTMPPCCVVTVEGEPEPEYRLSSLNIYNTLDAYKAGEEPIAITPEFDGKVYTGYSASVADYLSYVYMAGQVSPAPKEELSYFISNNWGGWSGYRVQDDGSFAYSAYFSSKGYAGVYLSSGSRDEEYQIAISQYATLNGLSIDGVMDKDFNRDVNAYHAYVDGSAEGVAITATGYKSTYTLTVNGEPVTSGTAYTLPYSWDENGKMLVTIKVSGAKQAESTYTVELEKQPVENKPFILRESVEADYTVIDKASYVKDLFVTASAAGDMTYQWFYNTTASTEGGTAIAEAAASTYTPSITEAGTRYYYCQITNTGADADNVVYSTPTRVTVDPDPTPVATLVNPGQALEEGYGWSKGYVYAAGATEVTALEVSATSPVDGKLSYQWYYSNMRPYNLQSYNLSKVNKATGATFDPVTSLSIADSKGRYYVCQVTNTFKGRTYTSYATTGETYEDYNVLGAYVFLTVTEAAVPKITEQPVGATYLVDDTISSLKVSATRADAGSLRYQWYVNTVNSTEGATAVESGYSSVLGLGKAAEPGTKYYFCVVTNTIQDYTATVTTDIVAITINSTAGLIGDRLTGAGTQEEPYLISTAADYQTVAELVAQKVSFKDMYLKQTQDIELPADWESIGCLIDPSLGHINRGNNMAAFSGTLDGDGHTVTVPYGGLPLLGYVKGATVKNLNISGERIAGYGLVNHLEGVGLSGEAICIDNVTLKSGSSTQKAGFIGTYITNNGFAGCSAAFYVTIKNSKIEENVVIGYDGDQEMIGSFAGRVHGTIENCVSYATVKGTNYVGGILGTRDNAMGTCTVSNCQFYGTVTASGEHAGGIVGGGYHNSTAPNGNIPSIIGCSVNATVTGKDKVGGIFGGDTYVAQSWGGWSLTGNAFAGTVKATSGSYVGGVIGYLLSMNKCTGISDNTFKADCGTDLGIGYVKYLDTSAENPKAFEGTVVVDTSKTTDNCPTVAGCNWRANFSRTDDPLGADARKLCRRLGGGKPKLEIMVNNSYMADRNDPQKAVLGEDDVFRIANRTASANYIWLSMEEGTTVNFSILRGKSGYYSTYQNMRTNNNVFDGTTYQLYLNNSVSLPLVARFDVVDIDENKATYYLVVDKGEIGTYAIGGDGFTTESTLYNAETGIAFAEAGQSLTLSPKTVNIGSGEDTTAKWKWATSDNHVALVDSNGKVTCVGGGEATITASCDQISITCTVTSNAAEHKIHNYDDNGKCSVCGDRKPRDISVRFTLTDDAGAYVTADDEGKTQLYCADLTVGDRDCDGTITYSDLFNAAHESYCADGTEGFATVDTDFGPFITRFWGTQTSAVGYYANNAAVNSMNDKVNGNANVVAFFYRDTTGYTDLYTWFDKDSVKTVSGYEKTFTVRGANNQAPKGATVTVLDETGAAVESLTTTVDEAGKFVITFPAAGSYTVWVKGTASYDYWGTLVTDAPVLPSFQTVEVFEPKSAVLYMTIVDDENNYVHTTDGEEVYRYAFKAVDDPENPDGRVTVYEALQQIHAQKCPAGADGFQDSNGFIQYVWGVNTYGWLTYYFDDVWMQGYGATMTGTYDRVFVDQLLRTEINDGVDDYTLYMMQTYGDIYTYFYPREQTAVSGVPQEFTAIGDKGRTPKIPVGASITVTDSQGNVLPELATTVDENGKFFITFPAAGEYTIDLGNAAKQAYTHSRCFVTVLGVEATKRIIRSGETTRLQLSSGGKVERNVAWTLAQDDNAYVSMTVNGGVATVRAMEVSEKHLVTITAATPDGELAATLTVLPKAQSVVLSQQSVTMDIGGEFTEPTFTAKVLPEDAEQEVTWTSSNRKVATVENGKVTITGVLGTTRITATTTDGTRRTASATVTVVDLAQSIALEGVDTILGGKAATFKAAEEDGTAIKVSDIAWSLSDTTYASVNASGRVTTKAVPEKVELTLTATIKGSDRSATKTITLIPAATYVDILSGEDVVTGKTLTRNINKEETELQLSAAVYPKGAEEKVTWTSSNKAIATVEDGLVRHAGKLGAVNIIATATDGSGKRAVVKLNFTKQATVVNIDEHEAQLRSGEKLQLSASTDLENGKVIWTLADSDDKAYVTLSNSTLRAKTVYEAHAVTLRATARDGGATAETTVTILPKSDDVLVLKHGQENVTKTTQSVNASAEAYTLTAQSFGGDLQEVTWKTSNKRVISLSDTTGSSVDLELLKSGTATITATAADGSRTSVTIKVTKLVESITVTGGDTVASGMSIQLKAVAAPTTAARKTVTWAIAPESAGIATVNAAGRVTAARNLMQEKTVTVIATAADGSGVVGTRKITVLPVATGIQIGQRAQTVNMQQTETLQLSAQVYPRTAEQKIKWASSNTRIATVDEDGLVTFHKGGAVNITATTTDGSNKRSTVKLTAVRGVEEILLDNSFVAGGRSLNLAKLAQVGPQDATNRKLIWSVEGDTAFVTLSANGILSTRKVTEPKTVYVTAAAADGYGAQVTCQIDIYPATTKVALECDGETVTGKTIKLVEGESLQLTGVNKPLEAYQDWTWRSSNTRVAEVDENGCVTGLIAGRTVTITCTAADGTARRATVTIKIVAE